VAQVVCGSASIGWDNLQTTFRVLLDRRPTVVAGLGVLRARRVFLERLCAAARRGVQVDVLLPGPVADKGSANWPSEAAYDRLTSCGVRVWNFQPSMMHAKIMIVDGRVAAVGSSNFNRRSLDTTRRSCWSPGTPRWPRSCWRTSTPTGAQ
jgi:cardiolipin synthase